MKIYNGIVGNRTRDLPAFSAVPQPSASQGAPHTFQHEDENKTALFTCEIQLQYSKYNGDKKTINHKKKYYVVFYSAVYCKLFRFFFFFENTNFRQCKILNKSNPLQQAFTLNLFKTTKYWLLFTGS